MLYRTLSSLAPRRVNTGPIFLRPALVLLLGLLLAKAPLRAQEAGTPVPDSDKQTIQLCCNASRNSKPASRNWKRARARHCSRLSRRRLRPLLRPIRRRPHPQRNRSLIRSRKRSTSSPNAWT